MTTTAPDDIDVREGTYGDRVVAVEPGGAEFIPHLIDDDSGVGTQVTAGDLNKDGKPDIIVANKKGVFVFIQL